MKLIIYTVPIKQVRSIILLNNIIRNYFRLLLAIFLFLPFTIYGQSYSAYNVKEKYDDLNRKAIAPYHYDSVEPDNDEGVFGEGMSKVLEGYLSMYKATRDKAYLYKFVLQSLCVIENRHDIQKQYNNYNVTDEPKWMGDENFFQGDGLILGALSRFVYLIKIEENSLYNLSMYSFGELNPDNYLTQTKYCNYSHMNDFNTFGDYADFIQDRVGESLWWFIQNGFWDDNLGLVQHPGSGKAATLNKQVGFSRAFFFIGMTSGEQSFLDKSLIVANLFKTDVEYECQNGIQSTTNLEPVFRYDSQNNAYWWYQNGWRLPDEDSDPICQYEEFVEDVGHGFMDILLVRDFYLFQNNTPFQQSDLVRLRNTLTNLIHDNGYIYFLVNGTDSPFSDCCVAYAPERALCWIILNEFDDYPGANPGTDVYSALMQYYLQILDPITYSNYSTIPLLYDGYENWGHAEVVLAQWEKECPNLTLYNRDVVYDQDFFSKCNLVIAPEEGSVTESFAEPIISTQDFIVEPNVESDFYAATSVTFKPGTHLTNGSKSKYLAK